MQKPEHCFFDPTHGAGVEEAELKTPAGVRKVMVCRADAEKLRRGEAPVPRDLPMGPQRVPAPQAPRSAGGSGLDWLDVFSVIVGGMGERRRLQLAPPIESPFFGWPGDSGPVIVEIEWLLVSLFGLKRLSTKGTGPPHPLAGVWRLASGVWRIHHSSSTRLSSRT